MALAVMYNFPFTVYLCAATLLRESVPQIGAEVVAVSWAICEPLQQGGK